MNGCCEEEGGSRQQAAERWIEISTDGVSAPLALKQNNSHKRPHPDADISTDVYSNTVPPSRVGLDPCIVTMIDDKGIAIRYTKQQRNFKSQLTRYRNVLQKKKERHRVLAKEVDLSKYSNRMANLEKYEMQGAGP